MFRVCRVYIVCRVCIVCIVCRVCIVCIVCIVCRVCSVTRLVWARCSGARRVCKYCAAGFARYSQSHKYCHISAQPQILLYPMIKPAWILLDIRTAMDIARYHHSNGYCKISAQQAWLSSNIFTAKNDARYKKKKLRILLDICAALV